MGFLDSSIEPRTLSSASMLCGGTRSYDDEPSPGEPPSATWWRIAICCLSLPRCRCGRRLRGHDLQVHGRLDLGVEADGHLVTADLLDGRVEVDAPAVDGGAAGALDRLDDLRRGHGAEQPALGPGLGRDHHAQRLEVCRDGAGLLEVGDLAGDLAGADALGLAHGARCGEPGQVAWQQVVATVAVGHVDDVPWGADPADLLVQDDLHDFLSADGVGQQRHLSGVLDRGGHVSLVLRAVAGDAAGADLAPVAHELAQQVDVLVVDEVLLVRAELTELALRLALERALRHRVWFLLAGPRGAVRPCLRTAARR